MAVYGVIVLGGGVTNIALQPKILVCTSGGKLAIAHRSLA